MTDLKPIKDQLETLAASCGYPPRHVEVKDNGSSHSLTCAYVGKREETHLAIARLTKHLLEAGLVESSRDTAPSEEALHRRFSRTAQGRDAEMANAKVTGNTDTMFTFAVQTSLPMDEISARLHHAGEISAARAAKEQVKTYLAACTQKALPFSIVSSGIPESKSSTEWKFILHIDGVKEKDAVCFFDSVVELTRHIKNFFGETVPVNLSTEGTQATLTISGNPALLLETIRQQDPKFISPQAQKTR